MTKGQIQNPMHKPVQENIPPSKTQRDRLRDECEMYVRREKLVGPLPLEILKKHAAAAVAQCDLDEKYLEFAVVVLNNELYRQSLVKIPYQKRLLLLPRCLRDDKTCAATFDEIGLLCRRCGSCLIDSLTQYAQQLGYSVLVAEGSPVVMALIEAGGIEAVIGVSCLSMLEKVFPYMEAGAFPGVAVPLLYDGCSQTAFDVDWLMEFMDCCDPDGVVGLDLRQLRRTMQDLFEPEMLKKMLGTTDSPVKKAAADWMALAGKRWRPALAAGVWAAISQADTTILPDRVQTTCVAIECFHKASLIHDDIEDGDEFRYGYKTLHAQLGVPIALNVGDYLIGLGYELITSLDIEPQIKSAMLTVASTGHQRLCIGQGAELDWMRQRTILSTEQVLYIFEYKTSPAFEVALKLGAILAGADDILLQVLARFSRYVGMAYQIRDDLLDWMSSDNASDIQAARLSILKAIAFEKAADADKQTMQDIWTGALTGCNAQNLCKTLFAKYNVTEDAKALMQNYRQQSRECLEQISAGGLKGFLRRALTKILDEFQGLACCEDHTSDHS